MCEYCEDEKPLYKNTQCVIVGPLRFLRVCKNKPHLSISTNESTGSGQHYVPINNCPMCGRKLKGEMKMSEHCIKCNFPCEDGETLCNECKEEAKLMPKKRFLRTEVFFHAKDLVDFVNELGIKQEEIQTITESLRIFYWEEDE